MLLTILILLITFPAFGYEVGTGAIGNYGHRLELVNEIDIERSSEAQLAFGTGVFLNYPLKEWLSIEADFILLERKYKRLDVLDVVTEGQRLVEVPILTRLWFWNSVSLGLGPYVSWGLGKITQSGSGSEKEVSYNEAKLKRFDAGVLGSILVSYPFKKFRLFFDTRYLFGLRNVSSDEELERKYRELHLIGGALWFF